MTDNLTLYKQAFTESFDSIDEKHKFKRVNLWVNQRMGVLLVTWDLFQNWKKAFNIEMEMDDVIEFSSFEKGKRNFKRYDISI